MREWKSESVDEERKVGQDEENRTTSGRERKERP